jgi:hypothetical protein
LIVVDHRIATPRSEGLLPDTAWTRLFGFVPLSPMEMGTVVGIVPTYLAATEATRRCFFRASGPTLA